MSARASMSTGTATESRATKHRSSTNSLLILTSARLSLESARADAAERQVADLLSRIRTLHREKLDLQGQLSKSQQELQLWKIQLNLAQTEIIRAQEIVDQVERARVDAEQRAERDRSRARRLFEDRAIELAMDEGRRLGFQQGLDHGRRRTLSRQRRASAPEGSDPKSTFSIRRDKPLDAPSHVRTLPVVNSTTPAIPETPQPSAAVPASRPDPDYPQEANLDHPGRLSPVPSTHDTFIIPPDNYIPTVREGDIGITLPPPHEWVSQPGRSRSDSKDIHPRNDGSTFRPRSDSSGTRPSSDSSQSSHHSQIMPQSSPTLRGRDSTLPNQSTPPPLPPAGQRKSSSLISRDSTQISQFELLSPPKEKEVVTIVEARSKMTHPERIVEEWRSKNSNILFSTSEIAKGPGAPAASIIQRPMTSEPLRPIPPVPIDRPPTADLSRSHAQKPLSTSTGPRKLRQVVLPLPIPGVFYDATASQQSKQHPSGDWLKSRFQNERTTSNTTVPQIDVEPPSHSPTNSEGTVVDPVLLTPEHASVAIIDIPSVSAASTYNNIYTKPEYHTRSSPTDHDELITGVIPNESALPPGFVPLSPIPTFSNLGTTPDSADTHSGIKALHTLPLAYKLSSASSTTAAGRVASPGPVPVYSSVPVPGPLSHGLLTSLSPSPSHSPLKGVYSTGSVRSGTLVPVPPVPDIVVMKTQVESTEPAQTNGRGWSPAPLNRPFSIFSDM